MAIVLALACALAYGAADFCGGLAARRAPAIAVVVWSQAAGLLVLAVALPFLAGVPHSGDLVWGIACGGAGALAVGLLYRALAIGTMGVVSPITAVLAAALPVTFGIVRGERPALLALVGIACALVAVVLVSAATPRPTAEDEDAPLARTEPTRRFAPGIPEAIGSGIGFGLFFIFLAQTHADAGLYPLLVTRITSLALLAVGGLGLRASLGISRPGLPIVIVCGALDMSANILFVLAAHSGPLAIVAVLSSLYPAATVALAAALLHERLVTVQWTGVAIAFAGVICISLAR